MFDKLITINDNHKFKKKIIYLQKGQGLKQCTYTVWHGIHMFLPCTPSFWDTPV